MKESVRQPISEVKCLLCSLVDYGFNRPIQNDAYLTVSNGIGEREGGENKREEKRKDIGYDRVKTMVKLCSHAFNRFYFFCLFRDHPFVAPVIFCLFYVSMIPLRFCFFVPNKFVVPLVYILNSVKANIRKGHRW
ncbi:hypothetical protein Tcan_13623 [Toxocara canis]|uniref:Uncharacterized protein n=1 Tax=Toxocara canis TaxID=6265 RepID=A0A0B2VYA3_TOXCA|nr:hypothetical protein Tcan_13623 [Toxocara canis]